MHPPPATPRTLPATLCTPSLHPHASQAFSASTAALAYAMEPLFAALFAAAILHESIHELQLLGGTLVVLANVLVAVGSTHVLSCFSRHC